MIAEVDEETSREEREVLWWMESKRGRFWSFEGAQGRPALTTQASSAKVAAAEF